MAITLINVSQFIPILSHVHVYDLVHRSSLLLVRIIDLKSRIKKTVNHLHPDKSLENLYNEMTDRHEGVKYELAFL